MEPLTALESLLAPPDTPLLGEALTLPPALVLLFTLVLVLVLLLTLVFVLLLSAPDAALPEVEGLALGLDVADWSVIVPWVPEPTLLELDWLVVVVWSPEPTFELLFWLPVPRFVDGLMFVLGLTFGLIVYVDPLLDGLCVCPDVVDGSAASAGPAPMTSAASESPVNRVKPFFMIPSVMVS
jgi:hypothetical protein